jgi:hypothetical protein
VTAPEAEARRNIDRQLEAAGWVVQDVGELNLGAGRGVAVREFPLTRGHGFADYLLYVEGQAIGVVEAKAEGATLTGVEIQTTKYSEGLPAELPAYRRPLPFLYQSTGVEARFTNLLDPDPRSRNIFAFHQPTKYTGGALRSESRQSCCGAWLKHLRPTEGHTRKRESGGQVATMKRPGGREPSRGHVSTNSRLVRIIQVADHDLPPIRSARRWEPRCILAYRRHTRGTSQACLSKILGSDSKCLTKNWSEHWQHASPPGMWAPLPVY